jgi:protein O-mannosyl-transferase
MAALIVLATIAAYSNSFRGAFILDDIDCILNNATIRHLWPLGPVLSPPSEGGRTVAGRPLVNLTLAINYAVSGSDVWSYHATNLLVHILAALTLWGVVRRTLRLPTMPGHLRESADWLATAAALLWALHPLTTAAVTYTVQRAESMMALFYLLMLYCRIRGWSSRRPAAWYAGTVVAAALGMASKEVMVTAPLVVLLYDRTFLTGSFRQALKSRWRLYAGLAATWLILGLLAAHSPRAGTAGFGIVNLTLWEYARSEPGVILHYLRLCVWPHPLCLDYCWPVARQLGRILLPGAVVTAMLIATAFAIWCWGRIGFLGAWFFLILAPTSSVIPILDLAFEQRMYLPLAAVVMAAVLAGHWVLQRGAQRVVPWPAWRRSLSGLLLVIVVTVLGGLTYHRNRDYQSGISIWTDTIAKRPDNPRAHYNLGRHYVEAGDFPPAREQFARTVQLKPDYPDGYMNLACAEARLGQNEEALADFDRAIQLFPSKADNYFNRGNSLYELGRFEEAIADYDAAIARNTGHAKAYYSRGQAQQKLKRTAEALASYNTAIRLKPDHRDAFGERAISYYYLKRYDEAWADIRVFRQFGGTPNPKFMELLSRASSRTE